MTSIKGIRDKNSISESMLELTKIIKIPQNYAMPIINNKLSLLEPFLNKKIHLLVSYNTAF